MINFLNILDEDNRLERKSKQIEYKSANRRTRERQLVIAPLLLAVLIIIASFIWITMVAVLPGAWSILPSISRANPSILSYLPIIIEELESYIL